MSRMKKRTVRAAKRLHRLRWSFFSCVTFWGLLTSGAPLATWLKARDSCVMRITFQASHGWIKIGLCHWVMLTWRTGFKFPENNNSRYFLVRNCGKMVDTQTIYLWFCYTCNADLLVLTESCIALSIVLGSLSPSTHLSINWTETSIMWINTIKFLVAYTIWTVW